MSGLRVVILGGYGFFGRRLAQRLAGWPELELLLCGRSATKGRAAVQALQPAARARLEAGQLDIDAPDFAARLAALRPEVVVHTAGPFQQQDYRVARACIDAGAHYIDLADGRAFVAGIGVCDAAARRAGVGVISGASSVPALSGAVADALARGLTAVDHIDIGISPGNRTERGLSTVRAILGYCGQPIEARNAAPCVGWQGGWTHCYAAPVGARLLSPCDVPDLDLLGSRYVGAPRIRFGAGLELRLLHRGMNLLAWVARRGWVRDWSAHARPLKAMSDLLQHLGSDTGAMHVAVRGRRADAAPALTREWQLLATHGDGPFVPTLAAAALLHKMLGGWRPVGAQPCLGLVNLEEIAAQANGLHITMSEVAVAEGAAREAFA